MVGSKSRISNDELIKLLKKSRDWNKRQNITGILIYRFSPNFNRGNFLQIVEGSKKSVSNVWRRISKDSKHHTVTILEEGFNEKRIFDHQNGVSDIIKSQMNEYFNYLSEEIKTAKSKI